MPKIISTMTKLGYSPDKKGVCFGIAAMGAQSVVREEPQKFYDRIKRIHNLTKEDIATLSKQRESKRVDELYHFFDGLAVYHGGGALAEEFKNILPSGKQSIENKTIFKDIDLTQNTNATKDKNNDLNFVDVKEKIVCSVTAKGLSDLVLDLKSHFKGQAFSLLITYPSPPHTVQIGSSNGLWLTVDHDNVNIHKNNNTRQMITNIIPKHQLLNIKHKFNICIDVLLSEQANADLSFIKKHEINDEQILKLKKNKKAIMDLIICCAYSNQHESLKKIFEHVDFAFLADECMKNNFFAMHVASCSEHTETTEVLLQAMQKANLTPKQTVSLLGVKNKSGSTNLAIAACYGYVDIVKSLLHAIRGAKLTSEQAVPLLEAKTGEGVPALFYATQNAHAEIVKMYLEAINEAKFTPAQKISLLEAKIDDDDSVPVLFLAAQNGHTEIVKMYLEAIRDVKFTPEQSVSLLEARSSRGASALFIAAQNGHTEIVKMCLEATKDAKFTLEQRMFLSQAKTDNGFPALFMAAQIGHTETVKAYLEAIEKADLPTEQKMMLLEAKAENGKTALEAAALGVHTEIVESIKKAIVKLKGENTEFSTWL